MFDLEVFYFLVSIKKLESSPCSRQNAVSVSIVLFPDRTRLRNGKSEHQKYSNVPIVAALHGLATGVSVSALVLRLSLCLCPRSGSIFVSLSLFVGFMLPVLYPLHS